MKLPVLIISLLLMVSPAGVAAAATNVSLSKEEVELLKRLDQIQTGAGISSSMLKAAPFITLFASPAPSDLLITIGTNDWDLIYGSLKGLDKIASCKTTEAIDMWKDVDGNEYSSTESKDFFSEIRASASDGC